MKFNIFSAVKISIVMWVVTRVTCVVTNISADRIASIFRTLKVKAISSSETLVTIYKTTWCGVTIHTTTI
jgi:predicted transporter